MLFILISPRTFPEEQLSKVNRMKGRRNTLPLTCSVFFPLAGGFPFPKAEEATMPECVPCGRRGQRRHSGGRAIHRLIFHRPLWIGSVCASRARCSPTAYVPSCASVIVNTDGSRNQKDLSIRLYSKQYFFVREKQWHSFTDKWHLNLPSGSRRNHAAVGVKQQKGCAHLDESNTRQHPAAALM